MKKAEKPEYVTRHELDQAKLELLDRLVTKEEFRQEVKRLDGSIEVLANQVANQAIQIGNQAVQIGENTAELGTLRGEVTGLHGEVTGLRGEVNGLRVEVTGLHGEVNELRGEMTGLRSEMHDKFNTVLTAIDGLSSQILDMKIEKSAGEHTFKRHEKQLDDHETRIEKLERKVS